MGTTLHTLKPNEGATKNKKRLGRGHGSGLHKTSGKGQKGQKARTGHHGLPKPGFEGGQTMLARRLPKRGFNRTRFQEDIFAVNLRDIAERFTDGSMADVDAMKAKGLVPRSAAFVKVLAEGDLDAPLHVTAHYYSAAARAKLAAAGGSANEIALPVPYEGRKAVKAKTKGQGKPA